MFTALFRLIAKDFRCLKFKLSALWFNLKQRLKGDTDNTISLISEDEKESYLQKGYYLTEAMTRESGFLGYVITGYRKPETQED
jgi:hypothetical protein